MLHLWSPTGTEVRAQPWLKGGVPGCCSRGRCCSSPRLGSGTICRRWLLIGLGSDPPSGFEFEPRVDDGQDGEERGGEATGPHEARPRGVNAQPVQRDEDVAAVLQQVQQQRRVAVQHPHQQVEPSPHPHRHRGQGWGGGGVLRVGGGASAGLGSLLTLHEEAELVHVTCQAEEEREEVVPVGGRHRGETPTRREKKSSTGLFG